MARLEVDGKVESTHGMEKPEGPVESAVLVKMLLSTDVPVVCATTPAREIRRAEKAANVDMAKFRFWSEKEEKLTRDERVIELMLKSCLKLDFCC